jgi:hypothetical protein
MKFVAAETHFEEILVNVGKVHEKYAVQRGICVQTQNVF